MNHVDARDRGPPAITSRRSAALVRHPVEEVESLPVESARPVPVITGRRACGVGAQEGEQSREREVGARR